MATYRQQRQYYNMAKRQKIDVLEAVKLFQAYSIKAKIFNFYQLRLFDIESGNRWDWYHTTGSLVSDRGHGEKKMGVYRDVEDCALYIRRIEDMVN